MSVSSLQELVNQAIKALQGGQNELAKQKFSDLLLGQESHLEPARRNLQLWMGLAYACGNCKDDEGALAAVDKALELEPQNPQVLLFKADHLWHCERHESAAGFYQLLLRVCSGLMTLAMPEMVCLE